MIIFIEFGDGVCVVRGLGYERPFLHHLELVHHVEFLGKGLDVFEELVLGDACKRVFEFTCGV